MKVPDTVSTLLISNSRILKEKFIQLIRDENTTYESDKVKLKRLNLQFSCYTPQNLNENKTGQTCLKLIDTIDKNVINSLINVTLDENKDLDDVEEAHKIKSIIYIFDESNIDTYTFIETFHKELKKNYNNLFTKLKLPCLLCNLSNILAIKSKNSIEPDNKVDQTAKIIEEFIGENKELTYTFYSSMNKIGPSNEQMNLVRNSFNKLASKVKFSYYQIDREDTVRPTSRTKTLLSLRTQSRTASKLGAVENKSNNEPGGTYVGEVKNNLRNGKFLIYYSILNSQLITLNRLWRICL